MRSSAEPPSFQRMLRLEAPEPNVWARHARQIRPHPTALWEIRRHVNSTLVYLDGLVAIEMVVK